MYVLLLEVGLLEELKWHSDSSWFFSTLLNLYIWIMFNHVNQQQQRFLNRLCTFFCELTTSMLHWNSSSFSPENHSYHSFLPWPTIRRTSPLCHSSPPFEIKFPFIAGSLFAPSLLNCCLTTSLPPFLPLCLWKTHTVWTKDHLPLLSTISRAPRAEEQELKQSQVVRSQW